MNRRYPYSTCAANHPHVLLDTLIARYTLKNDAALARLLEIAPPRLSKIRRRTASVSSELILRIHECCAIPIAELRALDLADRMQQDAAAARQARGRGARSQSQGA
jgi:plasmid maintenance system antidote protein VapI